jgi:hypothetical protein
VVVPPFFAPPGEINRDPPQTCAHPQGIGVYFLNAKISSKSNRFEEKTNHQGAPRRTKERGIGA